MFGSARGTRRRSNALPFFARDSVSFFSSSSSPPSPRLHLLVAPMPPTNQVGALLILAADAGHFVVAIVTFFLRADNSHENTTPNAERLASRVSLPRLLHLEHQRQSASVAGWLHVHHWEDWSMHHETHNRVFHFAFCGVGENKMLLLTRFFTIRIGGFEIGTTNKQPRRTTREIGQTNTQKNTNTRNRGKMITKTQTNPQIYDFPRAGAKRGSFPHSLCLKQPAAVVRSSGLTAIGQSG